jgi:HEAT repeat protein
VKTAACFLCVLAIALPPLAAEEAAVKTRTVKEAVAETRTVKETTAGTRTAGEATSETTTTTERTVTRTTTVRLTPAKPAIDPRGPAYAISPEEADLRMRGRTNWGLWQSETGAYSGSSMLIPVYNYRYNVRADYEHLLIWPLLSGYHRSSMTRQRSFESVFFGILGTAYMTGTDDEDIHSIFASIPLLTYYVDGAESEHGNFRRSFAWLEVPPLLPASLIRLWWLDTTAEDKGDFDTKVRPVLMHRSITLLSLLGWPDEDLYGLRILQLEGDEEINFINLWGLSLFNMSRFSRHYPVSKYESIPFRVRPTLRRIHGEVTSRVRVDVDPRLERVHADMLQYEHVGVIDPLFSAEWSPEGDYTRVELLPFYTYRQVGDRTEKTMILPLPIRWTSDANGSETRFAPGEAYSKLFPFCYHDERRNRWDILWPFFVYRDDPNTERYRFMFRYFYDHDVKRDSTRIDSLLGLLFHHLDRKDGSETRTHLLCGLLYNSVDRREEGEASSLVSYGPYYDKRVTNVQSGYQRESSGLIPIYSKKKEFQSGAETSSKFTFWPLLLGYEKQGNFSGWHFDRDAELEGPRGLWRQRGAKEDFDLCLHQWVRERRASLSHVSVKEERKASRGLCRVLDRVVRSDPDPQVREAAVAVAAGLATPQVTPVLVYALLNDGDEGVRLAAAHALAHTPPPEETWPWFLKATGSKSVARRLEGARAMGYMPPAKSLGPLSRLVRDPDVDVRREAAISLGNLRVPGSGPLLSLSMADLDASVREQARIALLALCTWEDDHEVTADQLSQIERRAVLATRKAAIAACLNPLRSPYPEVKAHAAVALLNITENTRVQELVDEDFEALFSYRSQPGGYPVRDHAPDAVARWLGRRTREMFSELSIAEELAESLRDRDFHVRRAALEALHVVGSTAVAEPVAGMLRVGDGVSAALAGRVLERFGTVAVVPALVKASRDWRPMVAEWALRALARQDTERTFLVILEQMDNEQDTIRLAAAQAFAVQAEKIGGDDAGRRARIEKMILLLRARIARALSNGLLDSSWQVRMSCATALTQLGTRNTIPDLIDALEDREGKVRMEAIIALRSLASRYYRDLDFKYHPVSDIDYRQAAVARWRRWWNNARRLETEEKATS